MLLGHKRQIAYFDRVLKKGALAHAYLLHGPEHTGKLTLAKEIAKFFYCAGRPTALSEVCQKCQNCVMITEDRHSEVRLVDTNHTLVSKKENRVSIPIEDIREIKRLCTLSATVQEQRIFIINEAERMSEEAANSFLKLLEEPGTGTLFFLITPAKDFVPMTITSRAQPMHFGLIPERMLADFIQTRAHHESEAREIIRYASGRPGIAISLLQDKKLLADERAAREKFDKILKGIPEALAASADAAKNGALRARLVDYMYQHLRCQLRALSPQAPELVRRANRIINLLDTTNVNPRLALDMLFLSLHGGN